MPLAHHKNICWVFLSYLLITGINEITPKRRGIYIEICINMFHSCVNHAMILWRYIREFLISLFAGSHSCMSTTLCISKWSKKTVFFLFPQMCRILCRSYESKHEVTGCCFCRVSPLPSWRVHLCWWTVPAQLPVAMWWGFWLPRPLWWGTYQHQVQKFRFGCDFLKNTCDPSLLRATV